MKREEISLLTTCMYSIEKVISVQLNGFFHMPCTHRCILLHVISDTMSFNPISHNDSLLRCEVNVSREPGLVLSVFRDGCESKRVRSAPGDAAAVDRPYVTLSETVPLRGGGRYECQLHLNKDLITESIFHHPALGNNLLLAFVHELYFSLLWLTTNGSEKQEQIKIGAVLSFD